MKNKLKVLILISLVFLLMGSFVLFINQFTFLERITQIVSQNDEVAMNMITQRIESALEAGKELDKFYRLDEILKEDIRHLEVCDALFVYDSGGKLIYSSIKRVPEAVEHFIGKRDKENPIYRYEIKDKLFMSSSVLKKGDRLAGYIVNTASKDILNKATWGFILKVLILYSIILMLIWAIGILFYDKIYRLVNQKNKKWKRNIFLITISIFVFLSLIIFYFFYSGIKGFVVERMENLLESIQIQLSIFGKYYITIDKVSGLENYLEQIAQRILAVDSITAHQDVGMKVILSFNFKAAFLRDLVIDNILVMLPLVIVSMFLLMEILGSITLLKTETIENKSGRAQRIRTQAFLLFLSYYLSQPYVPIRMQTLIGQESNRFLVGIPSMIEYLSTGIAAIVLIPIAHKWSRKQFFSFASMLLFLGFWMGFLVENEYAFIISRAIVGIGYGIALVTIRAYCIHNQESQYIGVNITALNAGFFSGLNIGVMIAGFVASFVGLEYIFIISAVVAALGAIMSEYILTEDKTSIRERAPSGQILKIFGNPKLLASVVLLLLPINIYFAFIEYYYPLYATNVLKWNYVALSRGYLANGMIVVFLGTIISNITIKYLSVRSRLISSAVLCSASFICLVYIPGGIYLVLILLAVAASYMGGTYVEQFMKIPVIQDVGQLQAMNIFTVFDKIVYLPVPMIYGMILSFGNKAIIPVSIILVIIVSTGAVIIIKKEGSIKNDTYY